MHKSKLIRLLQALTTEELRELGYFLDSPYFNTNQQVKKLFKYLRRSHPVYASRRIAKEKAFQKIFPEIAAYEDSKMRQVMFKLTRLLEDFLISEEVKQEKSNRQKHLIKALGKRNLYKDFKKEIQENLNELEQRPYKDLEDYQELLFLNHESYFHPKTHRFDTNIQSIEKLMDTLDNYIIMSKLRYGSEMITREKILAEKHKIWLLKEIQASEKCNENVVFNILSKLIILQKEENTQSLFFELKDAFIQYAKAFSFEQKRMILQYLTNHTIQLYNIGQIQFLKEQFELIKFGLSNGLYLENGQMTDNRFTNIAVTGSILKEFDWTNQFINDYQKHLDRSIKKSACHLAQAYWFYHKSEFHEALSYLYDVDYLPAYGFRVKSLRMRTYYELSLRDKSYLEVLKSDLKSFDQFIRRNKHISENRKKGYLNLILFTKKLLKQQWAVYDIKLSKEQLTEDLEALHPIFIKKWLLEKIEQLK